MDFAITILFLITSYMYAEMTITFNYLTITLLIECMFLEHQRSKYWKIVINNHSLYVTGIIVKLLKK